ncbi:hypothetical protein V1281_005690 [Nitrobacteraceae bacterium AZCC 2161]
MKPFVHQRTSRSVCSAFCIAGTLSVCGAADAAEYGLGNCLFGTGVLKVDGKVVATQKQPNSIAFLQVSDETFDVGIDTRTGVNDKDYQVPFAFDGKIEKLTVKLGPTQLAVTEQKKVQEAIAKARDWGRIASSWRGGAGCGATGHFPRAPEPRNMMRIA